MALDPTLPEPYAALGSVAAAELRRATADALLRRAIALRPSFATAYQWRGTLLMSSGKLADGLASLDRATSLDPRSLVVANNHGEILLTLGRYADAKTRCEPVLEFAPNYVGCLDNTSRAELLLGDFDAARRTLERLAEADNPSASGQGRELMEALAGRGDRHALALRYAALPMNSALDSTSGNTFLAYEIPVVLMLLGERELTISYLERLASEHGSHADWEGIMP